MRSTASPLVRTAPAPARPVVRARAPHAGAAGGGAGAGAFMPATLPPASLSLRLRARRGQRRGGGLVVVRASAEGAEGDGDDLPPELSMDPRAFRAKLVAQEAGAGAAGPQAPQGEEGEGWVYETPLLETGSVLMGAIERSMSFGLRQQYFHKCVILALSHTEQFTMGIILNKPTAYCVSDLGLGVDEIAADWPVWCGGDCQTGGLYDPPRHNPGMSESSNEAAPAAINVLHSLASPEAAACSTPVVPGVATCELEDAIELVKSGEAQPDDFWVFVGYAGWSPGQLQSELDRGSWYMASADSGLVLSELLRLRTDPLALPRLGEGGELLPGGDGLETWERLMARLGRGADGALQREAEGGRTFPSTLAPDPELAGPPEARGEEEEEEEEEEEGEEFEGRPGEWPEEEMSKEEALEQRAFTDGMLREWVRQRLTGAVRPPLDVADAALALYGKTGSGRREFLDKQGGQEARIGVGTVIAASSPLALDRQFIHKSLLLVLQEMGHIAVLVILNRPTGSEVEVRLPGEGNEPVRRRVFFGGDMALTSKGDGLVMLQAGGRPGPDREECGDCGAYVISRMTDQYDGDLKRLVVASGLVLWEKARLEKAVAAGKFKVVPPEKIPWDALTGLAGEAASAPDSMPSLAAEGGARVGQIRRTEVNRAFSMAEDAWRAASEGEGEGEVGSELADKCLRLWHESFFGLS